MPHFNARTSVPQTLPALLAAVKPCLRRVYPRGLASHQLHCNVLTYARLLQARRRLFVLKAGPGTMVLVSVHVGLTLIRCVQVTVGLLVAPPAS